jgi:hypothetical protein
MADCRKRFKKSSVIRDDGGHLGLLEHDLRNPDGIGVSGFPPGKIPGVLLKPSKKVGLEFFFIEEWYQTPHPHLPPQGGKEFENC